MRGHQQAASVHGTPAGSTDSRKPLMASASAHSGPGNALQTLLCRTECQSVTGAVSQAYWEISKKLMIVPYVPGSTDNREPLLGFQQPILPLEERQNLLFFRATCLPFMYLYPNNTRISTGKVSAVLTSCCLQTQTLL